MTTWPILRISDVAAPKERSIAIGPFGSRMKADNYVPQGVPVVRGNNIVKTRSPSGEFVFITDELADSMPGCILREGDLVFPHRGAIGEVGLIRGDSSTKMMLSTSLMKLRVDRAYMEPEYVYYYFSSKSGRDQLLIRASTVGTPGIGQPLSSLRSIPIPVPPLPEQRAIAATLGALDDKIESNRRAVAAARQLIRAHYDAALKQRVTASQVLTPVLGGTPKRDVADYWNGTVKWASAKDIAGAEGGFVLDTAETVSAQGIDNSAAKVMPAGTVVMTARGTVGALARLSEPMAFNQSCYGLRTRAGHEATLLTALEASVTRIKDSGHGTVFNTVNMATFDQIELEVPDDPGVDILLEDLSRKILQSMKENSRLTALRDALLPELLSGRVRVPVEGAEA